VTPDDALEIALAQAGWYGLFRALGGFTLVGAFHPELHPEPEELV